MTVAATHTLAPDERAALEALSTELQRIFGSRLRSVIAYGMHDPDADDRHSLALVDGVAFEDLAACIPLVPAWRRRGLAVPLILSRDEFVRSLDVFPLEYGDIIAHHAVVYGSNLLEGICVSAADLRRACELQAKSHLIHLREGFLETDGRPHAVARLISSSVPAFRSLLDNISRLEAGESCDDGAHDDEAIAARAEAQIGIPAAVVRDVLATPRVGNSIIVEPTALLSRYLGAAERIWHYVDAWRR